jgi:cell division protein FtsI/penicillin-binding protein 2
LLLYQSPLDEPVARAMAGRAGAVIVMEFRSGRTIAVYRDDFARGRPARPGSAIKPFTLAALLESAGIDPDAPVPCERRVRVRSRVLDCSHARTGQAMRAADALAYSCNCYFASLARLLTGPALAYQLRSFGSVSVAQDQDDLRLQALGEGNILVTPLELATAYRRLAVRLAGGRSLRPVLDGLRGCVTHGTGQLAQAGGLEVAGKTGTALSETGEYTHAWFAGFAPAESPEIVVVVFLERGQGGADAAPVARDVFTAWNARRRR